MLQVNKLYDIVRRKRFLSILVIWTRYLIGFAFIPSGLKKLVGERFTQIPVSNPIGFFFEALYQSGIYWNFLGFIQVLAAFLLMTQRFATIGNLIFLPIAINIFLITYAMHFTGTVYITFLLVVASTGLLLWDFPKWRTLFSSDNFETHLVYNGLPTYNPIWIATGFMFFVESLGFSFVNLFLDNSSSIALIALLVIVVTAAVAVIISFRASARVRLQPV